MSGFGGFSFHAKSECVSASTPTKADKTGDSVDAVPELLKQSTEILKPASIPASSAASTYADVTARYKTFKDWPLYHYIKPYHLARAGFYYLNYGDHVDCFKCKLHLKHFEPTDLPMLEHTWWSPKCDFVQYFLKALNRD